MILSSTATSVLLAGWLFSGGGSDTLKRSETIESLEDQAVEIPAAETLDVDSHAALEQYRKYLELPEGDDSSRGEAMRRLGDLNLELGETTLSEAETTGLSTEFHSDAIRLYEQLLERKENYEKADTVLYQLARAYESIGETEQALDVLDRMVRDYPQSVLIDEAQFRRGEILFMKKSYAPAAGAYSQVIGTAGDSAFYQQSIYKFGWAQFKLADYDLSIDAFLDLLDLRLTAADAHDLQQQLDDMSRPDRELVDDALRVLSLTFSYLDGAASLANHIDRRDETVYSYLLYSSLGELYLEKERFLDAAETFAAFVGQEPVHSNAPLLSMQAIEAYRTGRFPSLVLEAKQAFVEAYGLDGDYWAFHVPEERPDVIEPLKLNLSDLAQHDHAEAQKTGNPESYARAAGWYRRYLAYFPEDPDSAKRSFLLGEILMESKVYSEATEFYLRAAYDYPGYAQANEAGYAALLASRAHLETLEGDAHSTWRDQNIDLALRFARSFPAHAQAASVLTNTADELYANGQVGRSIDIANEALALSPAISADLQRVAWTVVAHGEFDRVNYPQAENAYLQLRRYGGSGGLTATELNERIAATVYRQAEKAQAAADVDTAVLHYLRLEKVAPGASIRTNAIYDAAALLVRESRWGQAIPVLKQFRTNFPDDKLTDSVTRNLAVAYEKTNQPALAAAEYERIADSDANAADVRRAALWRSGELYEGLENSPEAQRIWALFVSRFPQPLAESIEARQKLADLAGKSGDGRGRRDWLVALIDADAGAGEQRSARSKTLAAQASLELANAERRAFTALELSNPLAESLVVKKARMESALSAYDRAAAYQIAEVTTEATYRIGELYQVLSADLMNSERPPGLNAEELEQYEILLEEQVFPFEEKAIELFEINTARAAQGVYDTWVQESYAQLAKLSPARYAKYEKAEDYVARLY